MPKGGLNERIQKTILLFKNMMKWCQWLKAKLPTRNDIETHRALRWAKPLMNNKQYWKLNEQSISRSIKPYVSSNFMRESYNFNAKLFSLFFY